MTGSIKLAALFAGAVLILAQGVGTAQAGHGHKEKAFDGQRGKASYGAMAYKHGKAYGKRGKLHYQALGGDGGGKAYGGRGKLRHQALDGDGGGKVYGKRARRRFIDADDGARRIGGHRATSFFRDDDRSTVRRRGVDYVVLRHDGEAQRARVTSDGFVRRRSTDGIDTSGLTCGTASQVAIRDGRRVRIGRRVCRDAGGRIFAVAGSRQIIEYLGD